MIARDASAETSGKLSRIPATRKERQSNVRTCNFPPPGGQSTTMAHTKAQKETFILAAAISVMAIKIMLGIVLLHRWRMEALTRGEAFGDEEDQ